MGTRLGNMWQRLRMQLSPSSEPQVWRSFDESGQATWNADDPTTGEKIRGISEHEMRIWLEERHYHYQTAAEHQRQQMKMNMLSQ